MEGGGDGPEKGASAPSIVMAGLDPAIYAAADKALDARIKCGQDGGENGSAFRHGRRFQGFLGL